MAVSTHADGVVLGCFPDRIDDACGKATAARRIRKQRSKCKPRLLLEGSRMVLIGHRSLYSI